MATGIALSIVILMVFVAGNVITRVRAMVEEHKRALQTLVASKGWAMTPGRNGSYAITGVSEGVSWKLQIGSETPSKHAPVSTTWSSDDVTFPELVANIRTKAAYKVLTGKVMQMFGAVTKKILASGQTREVNVGGTEPFVVVAKPDVDLDALLTREVQRALGTWSAVKMHPTKTATLAVDVGNPNIRVEAAFRVPPDQFERFVDIGVQVVRALKNSRA